ncbi:cAMP-dependent protein kinase inhibitor beta [Heterocephalus glaber]|uniref:cAMP-dependent protein kinase inhibitor beta n=1 Tax=Heterocephalus glaber TaxID=10181 RepID=A0AAX6RF17_HETGA|nr:cAMP-dependent protein kinase inhibitor beta [Heterocephalus glaber]
MLPINSGGVIVRGVERACNDTPQNADIQGQLWLIILIIAECVEVAFSSGADAKHAVLGFLVGDGAGFTRLGPRPLGCRPDHRSIDLILVSGPRSPAREGSGRWSAQRREIAASEIRAQPGSGAPPPGAAALYPGLRSRALRRLWGAGTWRTDRARTRTPSPPLPLGPRQQRGQDGDGDGGAAASALGARLGTWREPGPRGRIGAQRVRTGRWALGAGRWSRVPAGSGRVGPERAPLPSSRGGAGLPLLRAGCWARHRPPLGFPRGLLGTTTSPYASGRKPRPRPQSRCRLRSCAHSALGRSALRDRALGPGTVQARGPGGRGSRRVHLEGEVRTRLGSRDPREGTRGFWRAASDSKSASRAPLAGASLYRPSRAAAGDAARAGVGSVPPRFGAALRSGPCPASPSSFSKKEFWKLGWSHFEARKESQSEFLRKPVLNSSTFLLETYPAMRTRSPTRPDPEPALSSFAASSRSGRRNALPDILGADASACEELPPPRSLSVKEDVQQKSEAAARDRLGNPREEEK